MLLLATADVYPNKFCTRIRIVYRSLMALAEHESAQIIAVYTNADRLQSI